MRVSVQILLGSAMLASCGLLHIMILTTAIRTYRSRLSRPRKTIFANDFATIVMLVLVIVLSHTIQIYGWASALWLLGALKGHEEPIYFALVSYTTLGYGDVTLDADFRIFGAMASVTGILTFGISTAFLVGFFTRSIGTPDNDRG